MKRKVLLLFLFLLIVVALTACMGKGDKPSGIGGKEPGVGRGTVSNVEPLNNGIWQVWIFGDSTYVYCTLDASLVAQVKSTMLEKDATVLYTYRDWKIGDPEYESVDGSGYRLSTTCGQLYSGVKGSKLLSIQLVNTNK